MDDEEGFSVLPQRYNDFIRKHQQDQGLTKHPRASGEEQVDFVGGHQTTTTKDAFLYPVRMDDDDDDDDEDAYAPASTPMRGFPAIRISGLFGSGAVSRPLATNDDDDDDENDFSQQKQQARGTGLFFKNHLTTDHWQPYPMGNRRFTVFVIAMLVFALTVISVAVVLHDTEKPNLTETSHFGGSGSNAGTDANPNQNKTASHFHDGTFTPTSSPTASPTHVGGGHDTAAPVTAIKDDDDDDLLNNNTTNGTIPTLAPIGIVPAHPSHPILENVWKRRGTDLIGKVPGDMLGETVVLNREGNVLVVGAPGANNKGGLVMAFYYNNRTWSDMGGAIQGVGQFGVSLDLSHDGTILAVGGNLAPTSVDDKVKGHVRVYRFAQSVQEWTPMGDALEGDQEHENLGWSVSLSGDGIHLAVGSPTYGMNKMGRVQMFFYRDGQWQLSPGQIRLDTSATGAGHAVSISDNGFRLALVSTSADKPQIRVWQRFNNSVWLPMGAPILNAGDGYKHLGQRMELSGDGSTLVLAAHYSDRNGFTQAYKWNNAGWRAMGQALVATEDVDGDGLADEHLACAVNEDGTHIAIGSPRDAHGNGLVRVYQYHDDEQFWFQVGEDVRGPEGFGQSVSVSGDAQNLAVGAGHYQGKLGLARVYQRHPELE